MPKRVAILGLIGTIIQWMDYTLYGYLANIIAQEFLPQMPLNQRLTWVFAIFASGLLLRPLGALYFGHLADRHGRKKAMICAIFLMGFATLAMGFLPAYTQWGISATVCLFLLRIIQSMALAGENGVSLFILEHSKKLPNFFASLGGAAASAGMCLTALLIMLFTSKHLPHDSWRIAYIISSLLCIIFGFLRFSLPETPEFKKIMRYRKIRRSPFFAAVKKYPGPMAITFSFAAFMGLYTYICNIYFHTYLTDFCHFRTHSVAVATIFGQMVAVCMIPLAGLITDYTHKHTVLLVGLVSTTVIPPFMFILADTHTINNMIFAMFLYGVGMGLSLAPMFKTLFDLFPTELRYSGITVPWNISIALFGSTAALVAHYFANHHVANYAGYYVSFSAIIAISVIIRMGLMAHLDRRRFRYSI